MLEMCAIKGLVGGGGTASNGLWALLLTDQEEAIEQGLWVQLAGVMIQR